MTDWGGKLTGAIIRIAGLLHLAEHGRATARTGHRQAVGDRQGSWTAGEARTPPDCLPA